MNVKFPNNTNKWQMEFNSAFKGLRWVIFTGDVAGSTQYEPVRVLVLTRVLATSRRFN
jgi:hypothetical protein